VQLDERLAEKKAKLDYYSWVIYEILTHSHINIDPLIVTNLNSIGVLMGCNYAGK
jgi:hypothetical protein